MDTYLQIARHINTEIRNLLPGDFSDEIAGQIFCTVTNSLTTDRDFSKDRQCPFCRQGVMLQSFFTKDENFDNRFVKPCAECRNRFTSDDDYPCRWCENRQ
jgi:hypothetical protein